MAEYSPIDYLSGLGGLQNLSNPVGAFMQGQFQAQQRSYQQRQQQMQEQQQIKALQRQQQYETTVQEFMSNPNAQNAASLQIMFPEHGKEIKEAFEMREGGRKESDLRQLGGVFASLHSGTPEGIAAARTSLEKRIEAEKAAGHDTEEYEHLLDQIAADPKKALGTSGMLLSAIVGPDKYANVLEQLRLTQKPEGFRLGPGDVQYDPDGNVIASSPFKPQLVTGPNGEVIEYTPSNDAGGGDGQARGVRNNNPGNIEYGAFAKSRGATGSDGRFAIFPTPEQGIAAQEGLLLGSGYHGGDKKTVSAIIGKYAPSSDGNPVSAYVDYVAKRAGVKPDQVLSRDEVKKVAAAMREFENGQQQGGGGIKKLTGGKPVAPTETRVVNGETLFKINGQWMRKKRNG
jgi:hypothetical protein